MVELQGLMEAETVNQIAEQSRWRGESGEGHMREHQSRPPGRIPL